jgi:hypothetical protein
VAGDFEALALLAIIFSKKKNQNQNQNQQLFRRKNN